MENHHLTLGTVLSIAAATTLFYLKRKSMSHEKSENNDWKRD